MPIAFRWNEWNLDHVDRHGVDPFEAEYVVTHATPPYPRFIGDGKWLVWGQTWAGRYLQIIYIIDLDETFYVIHARPLAEVEKRRLRRRRR